MKAAKQALLLLCTLALVGLGAAMPWLSAWMQDGRTGGLREEFDLNAVSLTLRRDAGAVDTLRLLSSNHSELVWNGETTLDPGDVLGAVNTVLNQLAEKGLLDERSIPPSDPARVDILPLLILSEDGALSAVVWFCTWNEPDYGYFYLDDATSKMVYSGLWRSGRLSVPEFNEQLKEWVRFCEEYYGVDVSDMRWDNGNPVMNGELIGGSAFVMTLQPEQGGPYELRLAFYELTVEFNAPKEPTDANSMANG